MFESNKKRYHVFMIVGSAMLIIVLPVMVWTQIASIEKEPLFVAEAIFTLLFTLNLIQYHKTASGEKVALYGLTDARVEKMRSFASHNPTRHAFLLIFASVILFTINYLTMRSSGEIYIFAFVLTPAFFLLGIFGFMYPKLFLGFASDYESKKKQIAPTIVIIVGIATGIYLLKYFNVSWDWWPLSHIY